MLFRRRTVGAALIWVIWLMSNTAAVPITTEDSNTWTKDESDSTNKILIKKCCQIGEAIKIFNKGNNLRYKCVNYEKEFNIDVYETNETSYWPLANISELNVKYELGLPCKNFYYLEPDQNDTFTILHNGSLFTPDDYKMENQYCVDNVLPMVPNENIVITTAILCESITSADSVRYITFVFLLISAIALGFSIGYLLHCRYRFITFTNYCLLGFVCCMAVAFFVMAIVQVLGLKFNKIGVSITGNFIYYLIIKYYLWLNMTIYCIYMKLRYSWYLFIPFVTPLAFVLVGCVLGNTLVLPNIYMYPLQYNVNTALTTVLYFVPIFCSLLINTFMLYCINKSLTPTSEELINDLNRPGWTKFDYKLTKQLSRMFIFIMIIMWILLIMDLIVFLLPKVAGYNIQFVVYDVLRLLLGLVIALVFLKREHRPCQRQIKQIRGENVELFQ